MLLIAIAAAAVAGLAAGAAGYTVVAMINGQPADEVIGGAVVFLALLILCALVVALPSFRHEAKVRRALAEQRLVAPARVDSLSSISTDDTNRDRYLITATVYPPDMPPYRCKFKLDFDSSGRGARWERGMVFRAWLVDIETGEVEFAGMLSDAALPAGKPKRKEWHTLRSEYIDGSAEPYRGPKVPQVSTKGWRTVELPDQPKLPRVTLPLVLLGVTAGLIVGVMLSQAANPKTVERVHPGDFGHGASISALGQTRPALDESMMSVMES